jgi:hypothetical protein
MAAAIEIYKVLICGDRNWSEEYAYVVKREIRKLARKHGTINLLLIEGGAPGVDSLVKLAGNKANVHVAEIEALWKMRRRSAGPQRNRIMAGLKPDEVIGIHFNIEESVGTRDMLKLAKELGIPNRLVTK